MYTLTSELDRLIEIYFTQLKKISENELSFKPGPARWSKKEIIGHLIDSAQNNIRRFIVSQYEDQPEIVYQQDEWVRINAYQQRDSTQLIQTWYLVNKQICHILENTSKENLQRICKSETARTIESLATDYIKHLRHHMHVVLDMEEIAYP